MHFSDHAAFHLPTNLEIREGVDYQCPVQDWTTEGDCCNDTERETCVWRPTNLLEVADINDYLSIALSSFNIEQDRVYFALQILTKCLFLLNLLICGYCMSVKLRNVENHS